MAKREKDTPKAEAPAPEQSLTETPAVPVDTPDALTASDSPATLEGADLADVPAPSANLPVPDVPATPPAPVAPPGAAPRRRRSNAAAADSSCAAAANTTRVSAKPVVPAVPKVSSPRPILAACLTLGAVLLFIALLDYQSHQAFFFSGDASLKGSNAIGTLGATLATGLFNFSGIAAFFIPLGLVLSAGFCLFSRARTLFPWRISLMLGAFTGLSILLSFFDSPDSWMHSREFEAYVLSGCGGALGNALYHGFLETVLGELGSFVLVALFYAFCLLGLIVDNPRRYISARIQWLGEYLKRHFAPGPRRLPAQQPVRKPTPANSAKADAAVAARAGAAPANATARSGADGATEDPPFGFAVPELPDAVDHAFLADPLGPILTPQDLLHGSGDALVSPGSESAEHSETDRDVHEPNTDDLLFDDFNIQDFLPAGTPDTGTVVRAAVAAAAADSPGDDAITGEQSEADPADEFLPEPDSGSDTDSGSAVSPITGSLHIIEEEIVERAEVPLVPKRRGDYQFPLSSLLAEPPPPETVSQENYVERAERLVTTLGEFKIKVEQGEIQSGPVITRYEVIPAPGVRVEKIASLANNLAMNLKAESVRVLAPVPGKGTVGIEVPNLKAKAVSLREIIESKAWDTLNNKYEIPIVLGKDVTGKPIIENLARMPHCLIAGSTGSGKSVCINGIVASLVYHAGPEDLRFIMVDPKVVELQVYNKLPHMLIPVVTDPKMVPFALQWLIKEMERRYNIFAKTKVKNIAGFNAKISKNREEAELAKQLDSELSPEERAATAMADVPRDEGVLEIPEAKLPYIVCFIDELADLMMVAPADIETCIARLAQLARAAGIHLILATQRPSVNVITGIIKANLPTRIAFKVTSQIDSRTILDQKGAETLIGRGDMLFIPPGGSHLVRAQGAYVSEEEIERLVDELANTNGEPEFDDSVQDMIDDMARKALEEENDGDIEPTEGTDDPDEDPMLMKSWALIRSTKKVSTSFLQRKLSIGYGRAAKIIDTLEERGYIGPDRGPGNQRDILRE